MSRIFYIIGKSAAGKDKIYESLFEKNPFGFKKLILYTTRPIRAGEENGREYHFVTEEELDEFRRKGLIIEERTYQTIAGPWTYATVDDGSFTSDKGPYLGIGTLESYNQMLAYFRKTTSENAESPQLIPLYIEVSDRTRLERSIKRESKQAEPNYQEVCRRFLADSEDFSEDKIVSAGITKRFLNEGELADCLAEVEEFIQSML